MIAHKRTLIIFLLLMVSFGAIFAESLASSSGLFEVQTEHFTIIYDKSTEESAAIIAQDCEQAYDYLVSLFKTDPELYFPVILTSKIKLLNANFSAYPANRIYLYDVVADKGSLTSFPETLTYIFRHELTHAFTCNFRSSFWQVLANIFADSVTTSTYLYSFQSLTEGIAVTVESLDGYGRMNDYASTRIVRQAKLEGKFPTWLEICGARDTYPKSLLPYIFGGAFLTYLWDTYGSDKVCEIFVRFGEINWFKDTTSIIEAVIGLDMKTLWNNFYEAIEVPSNVVTGSSVDGYTKEGAFIGLKALSDGSVMFQDTATYSLYKLTSDFNKSSKVVSDLSYAEGFDVSEEGLILVPIILENSNWVQIKTQKGKVVKTFKYEDRDIRGGAFVKDGVVLYTSKAQETFLEVYNSNYELVQTISLGYGAVASSFTNLKDGRLAFIYTSSATDNIALLDTSTMDASSMTLGLYENPISMRLFGLSLAYGTSEKLLSFEWYPTADCAENNSAILGSYGELNLSDGSFRLSKTAVLGGVNYPVRLKDKVLYSSCLYEGEVLNSISLEDLYLEAYGVTSCLEFEAKAFDINTLDVLSTAKAYNPLKHMSEGMLLPVGAYLDGTTGIGMTWTVWDPTETFGFNMSGLYTEAGFSLGLWSSVNGAIGNLSLPVSAGLLTFNNLLEFNALAKPSYDFYFDAGKVLSVADTAYYTLLVSSHSVMHVFNNTFSISYTSATSTGLGLNKTLGYKVAIGLNNLNPIVSLQVNLPFFIPVSLKGSVVYNLDAKLFGTEGEAKLSLFTIEVQKGTRLLGIYLKRFALEALYDCIYVPKLEGGFSQTITLRAYAEVAPLIGMLAASMDLKLGVKLVWNPAEGSPKVSFAIIN